MDNIVWGIDGSVSGHAGAYINFSLGPYIGTPDEAEIQSVAIGLGELLASQGQYLLTAQVNAVRYIGDRQYDRARDAQKAVSSEEARANNDDYWRGFDEHVRAAIKYAPTEISPDALGN